MKAIRESLHLSQWEKFKESGARVGLHFCGLAILKSRTSMCDFVYNTVRNLHEGGTFEFDKKSFWQLQF